MSKTKGIIVAVLLIIIAVIVFLILRGTSERVKLTNLLSGVYVEKIRMEGKDYSIKNGRLQEDIDEKTALKIMRLAAFYQWNKEDPLFDSPDFNPEDLIRTIGIIEEEETKLQNILGRKESIYPINFLKNLAEVSKKNREFLNDPSDAMTQDLIGKQKETASLYKKEAQDLLNIIPSSTLDSGGISFNVRITGKVITEDFKKIVKNAESLAEEIKKRELCYLGQGICIRPMHSFMLPVEKQSTPETPLFLEHKLIYPHPEADIRGPYRALSPCFGWGETFSHPEHYFYIAHNSKIPTKPDLSYVRVELATDAFYRKVTKGHPGLGNVDADHIYVPSNLGYLCSYAGYIAEIGQISLFLSKYKPIFEAFETAPSNIKSFFAKALAFETKFFNESYQSYKDLSTLSAYYAYAYKILSENSNAPWINNYGKKEEFLKRYLEIDRKLGTISPSILRLLLLTIGTTENYELIDEVSSRAWEYVYTFKNYYGISYLPFSRSVWRSQDQLQYLEKKYIKGALGINGGYLNYNEAVKHYTSEEIEKFYVPARQNIEEVIRRKQDGNNAKKNSD